MNAADQSLVKTIVTRDRTALQSTDYEGVFSALDASPIPAEKLRAAFARHH